MATTRSERGGPDPIDVMVGLRLRDFRKAKGYSQSDLAVKLGVTFQQVQKYERGANRISASMLVKAAKAIGVAPGQLLPEGQAAPGMEARDAMNLLASIRGADELVGAFARMPPRLRIELLRFAKSLALHAEDARANSN
jgi:transcriptional regulator with XRE-family HTH domain